MEISVRDKGSYKIVDLVGKIDRLRDSLELKSVIVDLLAKKSHRIALNLAQVTYLDSGALNVFIFSSNSTKEAKGDFCLIEPNEYVTDVLEVVGLTKLITVYASETEFEGQIIPGE